jgi:hypothetical protein
MLIDGEPGKILKKGTIANHSLLRKLDPCALLVLNHQGALRKSNSYRHLIEYRQDQET